MRRFVLVSLGVFGCADGTGTDKGADPDGERVANVRPDEPDIAIAPPSPTTTDDLRLSILEAASDPDGEIVGQEVRWFLDNTAMPQFDDLLLIPATETTKGEEWEVRVVALDDEGAESHSASDAVEIANSPPAVTVTVSPAEPTAGDDVQLTLLTVDADGDTVDVTVTWSLDGNPSSSWDGFQTLPSSATARGDRWTARVATRDDSGVGEIVILDIDIVNAVPIVTGVQLSPTDPAEGETLSASGTAVDPEGDAITWEWSWSVEGVVLVGPAGATLDSSWFDKGQQILALATPVDSEGGRGDPGTSDPAIARNSLPALLGATVDPPAGDERTTFSCVGNGWRDPDPGDLEDAEVSWRVNGALVAGDTLGGASFDRGDSVGCAMTPFDGEDSGPLVSSATVTIANAPPTSTGATLGPDPATEATELAATGEGFQDPDGDPPGWTVAWQRNGASIGWQGSTLDGARFDRGDVIQAEVSPWDGLVDGLGVLTNAVTIANTAPTLGGLDFIPSQPNAHADTMVIIEHVADVDGDTATLTYTWFVDGVDQGVDSATLPVSHYSRDQLLDVVVEADDGFGGTASLSGSATVGSAPPSAPTVAISPASPDSSDNLVCSLQTPSVDPDGDPVTYTFAWTVDGVPYGGASHQAEASLVSLIATYPEELWRCTAEVSDGVVSTVGPVASAVIQAVPCGDNAEDDGVGECVCELGFDWCDGSLVDCCAPVGPELDLLISSALIAETNSSGNTWDNNFFFNDPDPYVKIRVDGVLIGQTVTDDDTFNPYWGQRFFDVEFSEGQTLQLQAYDDDNLVADDFIGSVTLQYADLVGLIDGGLINVNTSAGNKLERISIALETP